MLAVAQISEPCLQGGAVVLLDHLPVRLDVRIASDGGPLARRVDERDVDVRVRGELVRLVRLGVCGEY